MRTGVRFSIVASFIECCEDEVPANDIFCSEYPDDGKSILLDANENAYGHGINLSSINGSNGQQKLGQLDLASLNRYPDP